MGVQATLVLLVLMVKRLGLGLSIRSILCWLMLQRFETLLYLELELEVRRLGSIYIISNPWSVEIDDHSVIADLQRKQMGQCMKGLSQMEIGIRHELYWDNGLRKNSAEALTFMKNLRPENELVRALLDRYNDDNNLSGDLVYELIEIVRCDTIHEGNDASDSNMTYYHLNLVIRTKGVEGRSDNLFFAEVACMEGKYEEFVLTFLCMIKPDDNGKCMECDDDMRHPNDVEYKRGRAKIPMPGMGPEPDEEVRAYMEELVAVYDEAELKAQEARVRKEFKELYHRGSARVQKKYVVPARRQEKGTASVRSTA